MHDTATSIVNPYSKTHGAPDDEERHVGDLGNFKTDSNGNAEGTITDKNIKLIGPTSVLGVCELPPATFPPPPTLLSIRTSSFSFFLSFERRRKLLIKMRMLCVSLANDRGTFWHR